MLNKKALAASLSAKETDADFKQTVLLLHGDGTNGAQNNTFTDSSTNAFTITRNGNTTQGTFSPFSQTGWSNYFDGSGDYLQLADSTAWDLSGDYTIEMWINVSAISSSPTFFQIGSSSLLWYISSATKYLTTTGSLSMTASTAITLNSWNHIAICRSGSSTNNTKMYLNGVKVAETTNTTSFTGDGSNGLRIGAEYPSNYYLNGYISNLRVVNGTAVYTADFTPPTAALTAITNTSLLTCQSNRFVDNSSNAFAITVNGNTSVQAFSPFAPTDAYSASTNGGSGYFDGTGDYLTVATASALQFGTGDLTVEFWVYGLASGRQDWFEMPGTNRIQFLFEGTNVGVYINNSFVVGAANTPVLNQWNHIAWTRSSGTNRVFLNGVKLGSDVSNSTNFSDNSVTIGTSSGGTDTKGYFAGVRILKGTAQYTAAFTPPTAPLTAITNTSLLCNFTNAGIIDQTGKNNLETVGNAQIDTGTKKFGTGSIKFDGNDVLILQPTTSGQGNNIRLGSGAYTVEFWVYFDGSPNSGGTNARASLVRTGSADGFVIQRYDGEWEVGTEPTPEIQVAQTLNSGQWYHVALVRQALSTPKLELFIDGTSVASRTNADVGDDIGGDFYFGNLYKTGGTDRTLTGYIDDLRITKGVARYTANFTAPTKAFADQ